MTSLMAIGFFVVLLASFLVAARVGVIRKNSSFKEIAVGDKELSSQAVIFSVIGTNLGGAITVGFIGLSYIGGVALLIAGYSFLVGILALYALIPTIRSRSEERSYSSIEEFISEGNSHLHYLVSLVNTFVYVGLLISQFLAIKLLFNITLGDFAHFAYWITTGVIVIYTVMFGYKGIVKNDILQTVVITLWFAVIIYVLASDIEGVMKITELPTNLLDGTGMGVEFLIVILLFFPWTALARAEFWQRLVSAKSSSGARNAFLSLSVIMFFVYTLLCITGLYLRANNPGQDYNGIAFTLVEGLDQWVVAIAFIGIFSALISSADSFLNISSISISSKFKSKKNISHIFRAAVIFVGLCALVLTEVVDDLGLWVIMASTGVIILVPGFVSELLFPHTSKGPFILSIYGGATGYILALLIPELGLTATTAFVGAAIGSTAVYSISRSIDTSLGSKCKTGGTE